MFDDLPETNPAKNARKPRAIAGALFVQAALVATILLIQMALPQKFGGYGFISVTSAAPPPPLGQPAYPRVKESRPKPERKVEPSRASAAEPEPAKSEQPVPQGFPNGEAQGVPLGIAGGEPGGNGEAVRIGGNLRPPQIVKLVKPTYPREAIHAHVEGVVVLEATVTASGDVVDVKVISGPPLLIPAAIKAVEEWKYEPTFINGRAVPVILTATVNFSLRDIHR
jgi:protein TonB